MSFWKLVAAIIVANLLTGVAAAVLWLLFIASLLGSAPTGEADAGREAPAYRDESYQGVAPPSNDVRTYPSARGRKLSPPDANGCIKELAEEAGGHC